LRKDSLLRWAQAISGWWLAFWALAAASGSLVETAILRAHHCRDGMNSLRFGNQIYAILIVLLLIRIQRRTWPSFVNVAETTYGIYLIHAIVINLVFAAAARVLYTHEHIYGPVGLVLLWVVLAPTAYFLSLRFTQALASNPRWGWTVGAANSGVSKRVATTVIMSEEMAPAGQSLGNA
jgi:membrane-bound acyltransferase YfiQ involved in biofilm formation